MLKSCITLLFLALVIGTAISVPMYYKKTDEETYEPGKYIAFAEFWQKDDLNSKSS